MTWRRWLASSRSPPRGDYEIGNLRRQEPPQSVGTLDFGDLLGNTPLKGRVPLRELSRLRLEMAGLLLDPVVQRLGP